MRKGVNVVNRSNRRFLAPCRRTTIETAGRAHCISDPAQSLRQGIIMKPELKTLEWNILNPDRLINLEIKNKGRTSII